MRDTLRSSSPVDAIAALTRGELRHFARWTEADGLDERPGVVAVVAGDELLFVGAAGAGGIGRLLSAVAEGNRAGTPFSAALCERVVMPKLRAAQVRALDNGERLLDRLTAVHLAQHCSYRVWIARDDAAAARVARALCRIGLPGLGRPSFDPAPGPILRDQTTSSGV